MTGAELQAILQSLGWSQTKAASWFGVNRGTIARWIEGGDLPIVVARLCVVLRRRARYVAPGLSQEALPSLWDEVDSIW